MTQATELLVIAKQPVPGRVKTRLHPALSFAQAARVAELCLDRTLETADRLPFARRTLVWAGDEPPSRPGWRTVPQVDGALDQRIAAALDAADGPVLLIGMDTPQLAAGDVAAVLGPDAWRTPAVLGPAHDGGFWALGLLEPRGDLVCGVPMSRADTGARQLDRLRSAGLEVGLLPELRDVDTIDDAEAVAGMLPGSALDRELREMLARTEEGAA